MKIVHMGISDFPVLYPRGGAMVRQMVELAKAQAARGHEVILYSADKFTGREKYHGVEIRSVNCRLPMPFRDIEYTRKAIRELGTERPDILHFHSISEGAALTSAIPAKKFLSFNYFIFRRGKKTPLFWWYRKWLKEFTCVLPISEYCRHGFEKYWGPEGAPVHVVYNGVNLEQFAPDRKSGQARRHALGIQQGTRVVLYVGRVCEQKGTDVLLQGFAALKKRLSDVRLVVAGPNGHFGNHSESDLTRQIAEVGGLYLGAVEDHILASIYNLADVLVMPTRRLEMFGMAALEAQACGKPVVCSDHGGLREIVSPESGLFFPVGDSGALAECLVQVLGNPNLCRAQAAGARKNALRFGWNNIAEEIDNIYCAAPNIPSGIAAD